VVAHRLRQQASAGAARSALSRSLYTRLIPARWWPTLYAFAISEGYLKDVLKVWFWFPMRRLGVMLRPLRWPVVAVGAVLVARVLGGHGSSALALVLATALILSAFAFSVCGLDAWQRPTHAVLWICGSNLLAVGAMIAGPGRDTRFAALFYAIGLVTAAGMSVVGLSAAGLPEGRTSRFAGLWEVKPVAALVAFLGAVGIAGVPLWLTFWGEDLVVHATLGEVGWLVPAIPSILAVNGYLAMRNFSYVFMGRVSEMTGSPT
jgi:hypothetical protein